MEKAATRDLVQSAMRGQAPTSYTDRLALAIAGKVCIPPTPGATSVDCVLKLSEQDTYSATRSLSDGRFVTLLAPTGANEPPLLVWKNGTHDGDLIARPLNAQGCQFDRSLARSPRVLLRWDDAHPMTHNTALLVDGSRVVALGGQHLLSKPRSKVRQLGIHHVEWERATFSARWPQQEHGPPKLILNGTHPGCVERLASSPLPGVCSFDGRLSVARLDGIYHLYARQNPTARGSRYVQHAASHDLIHWTPFQSVHFAGLHGSEGHEGAGEIYTFGAQPHPLNSSWLIALFPYLTLDQTQRERTRGNASDPGRDTRELLPQRVQAHLSMLGSMSMACSRDGVHWSAPTPLVECLARFHSDVMGQHGHGTGSWRSTTLPVHNGIQVTPDGSAFVWLQEEIAGMGRGSCLGLPKVVCNTFVRRYRLKDDSVLRGCMRDDAVATAGAGPSSV